MPPTILIFSTFFFAALSLHSHALALAPSEVPVTRRGFLSRQQAIPAAAIVAAATSKAPLGWSPIEQLIPPANAIDGDSSSPTSAISISSLDYPNTQYITTLILDGPSSSAGVELADVKVASRSIVYVKSTTPDGEATKQGIEPGMILLKYPNSSAAKKRIKAGPYPIVLQFYNLAENNATRDGKLSAQEALELVQGQKAVPTPTEAELYGNRGAGLGIKTIQKAPASCTTKSEKGDVLEVKYEARIGGRGGIVYDSSDESGNGLYKLGKGEVIAGVDLGTVDMCVGEVREIDIPSPLAYPKGNQLYLIPPGSRLFWRVELVGLGRD
jgi:FKBP-type peptidyl-prolyl cis-trans isomerase